MSIRHRQVDTQVYTGRIYGPVRRFVASLSCQYLFVWLAQLVKALAAPTHVRSCVQKIRVRSQSDAGFHPSGVGDREAISMQMGDHYIILRM